MKQVSAKLKNRGATAAVLMLALGAAAYLNWSFSREAPSSLVASEDIAADAVETSAAVSEILTAEEVTRIRDALLNQCKGLTAQDITIVEVK